MTLAAITMTAPEAASPVQMYRATYSPMTTNCACMPRHVLTRRRIKKCMMPVSAGHPNRRCLSRQPGHRAGKTCSSQFAGEIEDEDSTLAERQEARAERFTGYSGKRGQ